MLDWQTLIAIIAIGIAAITLLLRLLGGSLTRHEHEEFRSNVFEQIIDNKRKVEERLVIREFENWVVGVRRDIDRLERMINNLDQTKPTTGELDRTARSLESRLTSLELFVHAVKNGGVAPKVQPTSGK